MDTQTLNIFTQFVDFVKNIDNYTTAVEQIKQATNAHAVAYDKLAQGKSLAEYQTFLDKTKEQLDMERKEFDKACQTQLDSFKSRTKVLDATESALNDKANNLKEGKDLLDFKFDEANQKQLGLDKREQDLNAREEQTNQILKDLAEKQAQLKLILGS